jgi:transcriptional regulator PpsR
MPDAFVITNAARQIISGNNAFLDIFNISNIKDVIGQHIDIFFDRPNVDCNVLIANVREHTTVRRFATVMRTRHGQKENVEIAATQMQYEEDSVLGFWIRPVSNMVMGTDIQQENVSRSNEQISNLVGHMPLKDIVRESTEMIEKLCIETALELTQNNRASAAQMLGVSRQSLYAKLGKADKNS